MSFSPHPTPRGIWEYYERSQEAYDLLARVIHGEHYDLLPSHRSFRGLTIAEANEQLALMRAELDDQTTLVLLASFEAELMSRCRYRRGWKGNRRLGKRLKKLFSRRRHVSVEEVLELAGEFLAERRPIQHFLGTYKHRHWLAHGRHFPTRSAFRNVAPELAWQIGEALLAALPGLEKPE